MKNKILIGVLVLSVLAILLGAGVEMSWAQGPANDSFWTAAYLLDTKLESIPPNASTWYRFDYGGDRSQIYITMQYGSALGLEFRVYTPDEIRNLAINPDDDKFIGRGTAGNVVCDTGRCASSDLSWVGAFPIDGTYYVKVLNSTNTAVSFRFFIKGDNITLGPPPGTAPTPTNTPTTVLVPLSPITTTVTTSTSTPVVTTTVVLPTAVATPIVVASPVISPTNDSPYTAVYIPDNRDQTIAANTSLWYDFDYGGDRSEISITLINGNKLGLQFMVYTPDQATRYVLFGEDKFIGRGTTVKVTCETGQCASDDLSWIGSFNAPGAYFVKVINSAGNAILFRMTIKGTNVTIH